MNGVLEWYFHLLYSTNTGSISQNGWEDVVSTCIFPYGTNFCNGSFTFFRKNRAPETAKRLLSIKLYDITDLELDFHALWPHWGCAAPSQSLLERPFLFCQWCIPRLVKIMNVQWCIIYEWEEVLTDRRRFLSDGGRRHTCWPS